jgi:hypothetical protein
MRRAFCFSFLSLCILAVGCGADEEARPAAFPKPEAKDARLKLEPSIVEPGEAVDVTVENGSTQRLEYGLGVELFRAEGGSWNPVPLSITVPYVLLSADPESSAGPRYPGDLVDDFQAPPELEPGEYLVSKDVSSSKQTGTAYGAFEVRDAE